MIGQFRKLYSTLILLACSFMILSQEQIERHQSREKIEIVEVFAKLLLQDEWSRENLNRGDLIRASAGGRRAIREFSNDGYLPSAEQFEEIGLLDEYIDGGFIESLTLRGHPRGGCSLIGVVANTTEYFSYLAPTMLGDRLARIENPVITVFDATDCVSGYQSLLAGYWVDDGQNGSRFFVLPEKYVILFDSLLIPDHFIPARPFYYGDRFYDNYQEEIISMFGFPEVAYLIPEYAMKFSLVSYASDLTGYEYKVDEIETAIDDIFRSKTLTVSFGGLSASLSKILTFAPFFILIILWKMYRILGRIRSSERTTEFWLAYDAANSVGLFGAMSYAFMPYLIIIIAALFYVAAMPMHGYPFGLYYVSVDHNLALNIVDIPPTGWRKGNTILQIIAGISLLPSVLLSLSISLRLFTISVDTYLSRNGSRTRN